MDGEYRSGAPATSRVYGSAMSDPSPEIFEVPTTRLGGGPSRRRGGGGPTRLPILLVIILAVAVPTVAWIGPRVEWRPEVDLSFLRPTPTPTPSRTPRPTRRPTAPPATPLPEITIGQGPIPDLPLAVDIDGLRLVDPRTGASERIAAMGAGQDAIFVEEDGSGWWCLCVERISDGGVSEVMDLEIRRLDRAGRVVDQVPVTQLVSSGPFGANDYSPRFDLELAPDGRHAYLATGVRSLNRWTFELGIIDLREGGFGGRSSLGTLDVVPPPEPGSSPSPRPDGGPCCPESWVGGPSIRLSPDGRRMLASVTLDTFDPTDGGSSAWEGRYWMLDVGLDPSAPAVSAAHPFTADAAADLRTCWWLAWLDDDELLATCQPEGQYLVRRFGSNGELRGELALRQTPQGWLSEPLVDRRSGTAYLWDPIAHRLSRLDLDDETADELVVDPEAPDPVGPSGASPRRAWSNMTSDYRPWWSSQLVPAATGDRLFAIGFKSGAGGGPDNFVYPYGSSGVWVFDPESLSLIDHWPAAAAYESISITADGRWLLAGGTTGVDVDGRPTAWQASLSVHATDDGRIVLRLGQLGADSTILHIPN